MFDVPCWIRYPTGYVHNTRCCGCDWRYLCLAFPHITSQLPLAHRHRHPQQSCPALLYPFLAYGLTLPLGALARSSLPLLSHKDIPYPHHEGCFHPGLCRLGGPSERCPQGQQHRLSPELGRGGAFHREVLPQV